MRNTTSSPSLASPSSPAERLADREAEKRSAALGVDVAVVSYRQVAIKLAVRVLMLEKKLKAAEYSLKEAESCAEDFVGSNWLKSTLLSRRKK